MRRNPPPSLMECLPRVQEKPSLTLKLVFQFTNGQSLHSPTLEKPAIWKNGMPQNSGMLVSTPGIPSVPTMLVVLARCWIFCDTKRLTANRNSLTLFAPNRRVLASTGCLAFTCTLLPVLGVTLVRLGRYCGSPAWL